MNNQGADQKFNCVLDIPAATGVLATPTGQTDFPVFIESRVRVETSGTPGTLIVEGRIQKSSNWTTIPLTSGVGDISTFDYIRFNVTVAGTGGQLIASGFLSFF